MYFRKRQHKNIFFAVIIFNLLLIIASFASIWWSAIWITKPSRKGYCWAFGMEKGVIAIVKGDTNKSLTKVMPGFHLFHFAPSYRWVPQGVRTPATSQLLIPTWMLTLASITLVVYARPHLYRKNMCRNCGYDLRGSAQNNTCPECGNAVLPKD